MKYRKNPYGSLNNETYPFKLSGIMCHLIVIQIRRKSPLTKTGSEIPNRTNIELKVSGHLFLKRAAMIPRPTPTINQRISAPTAKLTVIGRA